MRVHTQKVYTDRDAYPNILETTVLEDPVTQLLLPCQRHVIKMLVSYQFSFTLLNYQLNKWVKISLGSRFMSAYLLLRSMDSHKHPKLLNVFFVFRKCNLLPPHRSLPFTVLILSI